ncbi:MAG: general secretion pathway protein GspF [Gammaproteobacteria bacterium]|nr:general secretion pathway protein GspF [Gammaproteobacteria bacterium]
MLIRSRRKKRNYDAPQRHQSHNRPMTRRELIGQGFLAGSATVFGGGVFSLFSNPRAAYAQLAADLDPLRAACGINVFGNAKIPFICFDLAGGANMAGSNVLVGQQGGQMDDLSTAGYSKMGLPGDMVPSAIDPNTNLDHRDTRLGLGFHSDSAFLRGMFGSIKTAGLENNINGAVIPARSDNDTGNNPHNPMYGIQRAGAGGSILALCGSRNSESGGNSMAPISLINPEFRPTKVDRPSDVTGLVDTGELLNLLNQDDALAVMESIYRLSDQKLGRVSTGLNFPDPNNVPLTRDEVVEDLVRCGYLSAADIADRFSNPGALDPSQDDNIVNGANSIFTNAEYFGNDRDGDEFRKTASVMKMVIDGYAGAGCVTMGGYDYHGGARAEGEVKDFRAGRCMGACLEYASRANNGLGVPLMMYVYSDGSLSSNGVIDDTLDGRGKGEWTSDNSSTAASFFLVYSPLRRPTLFQSGFDGLPPEQHQQLGYYTAGGDVVRSGTPGANNVNLLVQMVLLNYMALHSEQGQFATAPFFPTHGLGDSTALDRLTAFEPICNQTIANLI